MRRKRTLDTISRLAAEERRAIGSEFLAPRIGDVRIRIAGVVCELTVESGFRGWGVFRAKNYREAEFVREATRAERERYLSLFPPTRMLIAETGDPCIGVLANRSQRIRLNGPVPIHFASEVQVFDTVITRFDGGMFLFDRPDWGRRPTVPNQMRGYLSDLKPLPSIPGTTLEERELYELALESRRHALKELQKQTSEYRLAKALEHGGAVLRSYIERPDGYLIEYTVDGRPHRSVVDKSLRVLSAGICLSGQDADFDITSLVSVIREGERGARIYHVGVDDEW